MTIDEIKELYKMIAERDDSIGDLISKIADKDTRIAELEADVSRLQSFCKTEYDNGLSDGLFNEEQERIEKNKKIQIQDAIINSLKQTIADLQKENLRLENEASRIDELEAEVKRFQLACRTAYNDGIAEGEKERLKLGGEIERMKCCGKSIRWRPTHPSILTFCSDIVKYPRFVFLLS